ALGRCGGPEAFAALQAVVGDDAQGPDRRAEAARQLVDRHGAAGADVVAAALRGAADLAVALRLVRVTCLSMTTAIMRKRVRLSGKVNLTVALPLASVRRSGFQKAVWTKFLRVLVTEALASPSPGVWLCLRRLARRSRVSPASKVSGCP